MTDTTGNSRAQMVYFSHGGGPLPLLGDPGHRKMIEFMSALPARLRRPEAIVLVSAHWEEDRPTLLGSPRPPMLYDYYGFPEETYTIKYPAPGSPALVARISGLLEQNGIPAAIDTRRGYDHGHFIPLIMMYPEADIPTTQLSLIRGLDPAAHLALGRALAGLLDANVLVIGSGFSFHNMSAFRFNGASQVDAANEAFQDWLVDTVTAERTVAEREHLLVEWESAPSARYCHPREEHLLPLHVCQGMAGRAGELIFSDQILGFRASAFLW